MAAFSPTAGLPTASTTPAPTPAPGFGNFPSLTLSNDFVKVRFFEPDVPHALNQRWVGMPRGVYIGFEPTVTPGSPILVLSVDPTQNFSLAKVMSQTESVMVDIFTGDNIELDFSAHSVWPVYVVATASYERASPTQGKIFSRATPANGIDEITLCKVDKPAADLVVESIPNAWQTTKATASASVSRTCLVVSFRRSPLCRIS